MWPQNKKDASYFNNKSLKKLLTSCLTYYRGKICASVYFQFPSNRDYNLSAIYSF